MWWKWASTIKGICHHLFKYQRQRINWNSEWEVWRPYRVIVVSTKSTRETAACGVNFLAPGACRFLQPLTSVVYKRCVVRRRTTPHLPAHWQRWKPLQSSSCAFWRRVQVSRCSSDRDIVFVLLPVLLNVFLLSLHSLGCTRQKLWGQHRWSEAGGGWNLCEWKGKSLHEVISLM